jgi:hypothetical protein
MDALQHLESIKTIVLQEYESFLEKQSIESTLRTYVDSLVIDKEELHNDLEFTFRSILEEFSFEKQVRSSIS